jgi:predicted permease
VTDERSARSSRNTTAWRRYLRFLRPDPRADFDDEVRDHIESTVDSLVASGLDRDTAVAEAHRRFGDVPRVRAEVDRIDARERSRRQWALGIETAVGDLRYALRGLRRSPSFTIVAAISIALGVAANATIFSVVNAILFRPIPGARAENLVRVYSGHHSPLDWHDLAWFRQRATTFDYIVGERSGAMSFRATPAAGAERIRTSYVTSGFWRALGARTTLGRAFDVDEAATSDASAVVLGYGFWQRRFAGDSGVIGKTIALGDHPMTVVGVATPDFRSSVATWSPDVFVPLAAAPMLTGRPLQDFGGSFYTTARLRGGVQQSVAEAELRALMQQLAATDSARYEHMTLRLDHTRGVNAELRAPVTVGSAFMMAMVLMVLLIACANVANLLLGRVATRRREMGVRLAIGASRARLIRQLLTESFALALLGSAIGFGLAWMLTRLLPAVLPAEAGIDATYFIPDGRVAAFTGVLCLATTIFFGLAPAFDAASPELVAALKGSAAARGRGNPRGKLIVVQTAMCVLLLAMASVFLRSIASMASVDPGFTAAGVVDVGIDLGLVGGDADKQTTFDAILTRASTLPGVQSVALAAVVPLTGSNMETSIAPDVSGAPSSRDLPRTYFNVVSPGYFRTLRTPVVRGRDFLASDGPSTPRVAVVNETAARRWWPNGDALGRRFRWGSATGDVVEIVGIARDAAYVMPGEEPKATVYVPVAQSERREVTLLLRTSADVGLARRATWDMLHAIVPELPPPPVARMVDDMAITLLPVRTGALLLGSFGALALLLAACGIYGVASYSVASRTREIGIRAALGATRARLLRMVVAESAGRVAIGAGIGLGAAIGLAALLGRVLYGVHALDVLVLAGVSIVIAVVALLSTLIPARRAALASPIAAIRSE